MTRTEQIAQLKAVQREVAGALSAIEHGRTGTYAQKVNLARYKLDALATEAKINAIEWWDKATGRTV